MRADTCPYKHTKVTIEEGLELIKKKAFPKNEHGEPRAPSALGRRDAKNPEKGTPKGDGRGHSPRAPKHCKKFLRDGECSGGKGCPGKKFHLTKEQLAAKTSNPERGDQERRGDSPSPRPLTQ